jgi:hypothetical protein
LFVERRSLERDKESKVRIRVETFGAPVMDPYAIERAVKTGKVQAVFEEEK